jgi:CBS domain-containing protein
MSKAGDYVRAMMSTPVVHVAPDATVAQALRTMIDRDIGSVAVAEGDSAVGVFTERDLTRRILDDPELLDRRVREVMSSPVTTVGPDDEMVFVFRLVEREGDPPAPGRPGRPTGGDRHRARPASVGRRRGHAVTRH